MIKELLLSTVISLSVGKRDMNSGADYYNLRGNENLTSYDIDNGYVYITSNDVGWYILQGDRGTNEVSIKLEKYSGDFTFNVEYDFNDEYIDSEMRARQNINNFLYAGIDYVAKKSPILFMSTDSSFVGLNHLIYSFGLRHKSGMKFGLSNISKSISPSGLIENNSVYMVSFEFDKQFKKDNFEWIINFNLSEGIPDNTHIFYIKNEIKKWYGNLNIFGLQKYEWYSGRRNFKYNIGIGFTIR